MRGVPIVLLMLGVANAARAQDAPSEDVPEPGVGSPPEEVPEPGVGSPPEEVPQPAVGSPPEEVPQPAVGSPPEEVPDAGVGSSPGEVPDAGVGSSPGEVPQPGVGSPPQEVPQPGVGSPPEEVSEGGVGSPPEGAPEPEVGSPPEEVPEPELDTPDWLDNSYAELAAAVRGMAKRVREHGSEAPPVVVEPRPVGVAAESINGALAALGARVAAAQTPPAEAPPEVVPEEPIAEVVPQESKKRFEQHTLFGVKRRSGRFGAHIGGTVDATQFRDESATAWGFEGGFVLGGDLLLGGAFYVSEVVDLGGQPATFVYGGFQPGLILWTEAIAHPRFDVLIGGGSAVDSNTGAGLGQAGVILPRVGLELNVSRSLRLSGNLGWRFVAAQGTPSDFDAFVAGLTLRFGWM